MYAYQLKPGDKVTPAKSKKSKTVKSIRFDEKDGRIVHITTTDDKTYQASYGSLIIN